MANKSVNAALDHRETSSLPYDSSQEVIHSLSAAAVERHLQHVELASSLRASLLNSSSPKHPHSRFGFSPTPPVPANSPFLTPSNSFFESSLLQNCENPITVVSAGFPTLHSDSTYPGPGPSSPSTSSFDLSLTSDFSDCPHEETERIHPFDFEILSPECVPKGVGLGIKGISKHGGSGEFDGVGLVSIRRSMPRPAHEANTYVVPFQLSDSFSEDLHDGGGLELSDTFLQEAVMTFLHDPFHNHSLATIPECQFWSELDLEGSVSVGTKDDSHAFQVSTSEDEAPLRRMKKHFSASTISSELKRTSIPMPIRLMNPGGTRMRSSTWPSQACSRCIK